MTSTVILSDNGVSSGTAGLKETGGNDGVLILQTTTAGGAATNAVYIDASQNVGIGTSSPGRKLEVNGQIMGTDLLASNSNVYFLVSGSTYGQITASVGALNIDAKNNSNLTFQVASSEKMRIDSSGNLLVGTTNASAKLAVEQTSATNAINANINYASSTNIAGIRVTKYDNNTTTSQRFVEFVINAGASGCGQINANGASTAAFGSYSDERLKENIVDLPSQLANICALRPVEFDYIGVEDGHQIGFIAQEMQQVYPDAVSVGNDEMLMITAWSKTEARLVKAIQEQQALITQLQADVAALKGTK